MSRYAVWSLGFFAYLAGVIVGVWTARLGPIVFVNATLTGLASGTLAYALMPKGSESRSNGL